MRIKRKYLVWAGVAALGGVTGWLAVRDRPLEVDVGVVRQATLRVAVDAEGKLRVRERYLGDVRYNDGSFVIGQTLLAVRP